MVEFELTAVLFASRSAGPVEHALVALLGMLGLRVFEAVPPTSPASGTSRLRDPAPPPPARCAGSRKRPGCTCRSASRLAPTFCTTGLVAGVALRDVRYGMCHADRGTTLRSDMANLDRHASHAVAAYLAGMSTG